MDDSELDKARQRPKQSFARAVSKRRYAARRTETEADDGREGKDRRGGGEGGKDTDQLRNM